MIDVICAENVTRAHDRGGRLLASLRGVSLEVRSGELLVIMGPSGSGKSTLLHLLGGLDQPTTGRVLLGGVDLASISEEERSRLRRRRIGFVFQNRNLLPGLSALENVALPLWLDGWNQGDAVHLARTMLEQVGLEQRADQAAETLSGGEMQRVAIARAIVTGPEVLLCDEPTGSLDSAAGAAVLNLLRALPEPDRRTLVLVTHDERAAAIGDRVIFLRDGRIEAVEARAKRGQGPGPGPGHGHGQAQGGSRHVSLAIAQDA